MITPEQLAEPNTEDAHQTALFCKFQTKYEKYPQLKLAYAIPNGGKRDSITASKLKAAGVRSGVPDVCIPVSRCGYNALYIEMKRPKTATQAAGVLSDPQKKLIPMLEDEGNYVRIAFTWNEAWVIVEAYLDGLISHRQSASPMSLIGHAGMRVA